MTESKIFDSNWFSQAEIKVIHTAYNKVTSKCQQAYLCRKKDRLALQGQILELLLGEKNYLTIVN